jgi:uncharacterized protein (TIGR02145 family)
VSSTRLTVTGTVNAVPTITRSGGNASQTVNQNTAITAITYTASNATSIALSSGNFPTGVSGKANGLVYTISGTPTVAGTFNYAVTASHTNGCTSSASSGAITVNTTPTHAKTTTTWTVSGNGGAQTWSDVINVPACNKTSYSASNTTADCRANSSTSYGYLYSWVYVTNNASTLCDKGWRVPTSTDFCNLDKNLFSTTTCSSRTPTTDYGLYIGSAWGGTLGGLCIEDGKLKYQGIQSHYWSSTENAANAAGRLTYSAEYVYPQNYHTNKGLGQTIRCVK